MKLTPQQIEVLRHGSARYQLGTTGSRTIKILINRGFLKFIHHSREASYANITDAGRQALLEATSGRVRLDKAVEGMVAAR